MRKLNNLIIFIFVMVPSVAFAQAPTGVEKVLADVGVWIGANLGTGSILMLGGAAILEVVLRGRATSKPLSIVHGIARLARLVADLLAEVARVIDELLPQKTK